jgi:hypothetical protein
MYIRFDSNKYGSKTIWSNIKLNIKILKILFTSNENKIQIGIVENGVLTTLLELLELPIYSLSLAYQ